MAILTFALGVGPNVVVFSAVNAMLLRPITGVADPDRLVRLYARAGASASLGSTSLSEYQALRGGISVISPMAAYSPQPLSVLLDGQPSRLLGEMISENYFNTLGVSPARGRLLMSDDGVTGRRLVVISRAFWHGHLHAAENAIGSTITISGHPLTIVGIAPPAFSGLSPGRRVDFWMLLDMLPLVRGSQDASAQRIDRNLSVVGRLRPGSRIEDAESEVAVVGERIGRDVSAQWADVSSRAPAFNVVPLRQGGVGSGIRQGLVNLLGLLSAAAAFVLIGCCVNVAGLLYVRNLNRQREFALRIALGAARSRLIGLLVFETLILSGLGAVLAIGAAWTAARLLAGIGADLPLPLFVNLTPDLRVICFGAAVTCLACLLAAVLPAWRTTRIDPACILQDTPVRSLAGPVRVRVGDLVIGFQIAVAAALVMVTFSVVTGLRRAQNVELGFDAPHLILLPLELRAAGYDQHRGLSFYRAIEEEALGVPGVLQASLSKFAPLGMEWERRGLRVEGDSGVSIAERALPIDAGYFQTLNVPITRGREFSTSDGLGAPRVAIVNATFAAKYWPGLEPVGRHVDLGSGSLTVVGVAANGRYGASLSADPEPYLFLPFEQNYVPDMVLLVRTAGQPEPIARLLAQHIARLGPSIPLRAIGMRDQLEFALLPHRAVSALLFACLVITLGLTTVGLYGSMAHSVSRGSRSIGIRIALGAEPLSIARQIIAGRMRTVGAGLVAGSFLAFAADRMLARNLFGVSDLDWTSVLVAAAACSCAALLASAGPTLRAMRINPAELLRVE